MVRRVGRARLEVELLGHVGVAERDAEIGGVGQPPRAMRAQGGALGAREQLVDRIGELAAVAQQGDEAIDRLREIGVVAARGLEQALGAIPVLELRELAGSYEHARADLGIDDRAARALEHVERFLLGNADLEREPRERLEHVRPVGFDPIGLAVRVERARGVVELALLDLRDLAEQLGALGILRGVDRAPAEQIDEHRPLGCRPVEQLERLVGLGVTRFDQ